MVYKVNLNILKYIYLLFINISNIKISLGQLLFAEIKETKTNYD